MAYAKSLANRISVSSFKLTAWSQLWHCQTFLSKWKSCQTGLAGHPTLLLVLTKPSLSTGPLGCHRVLWKLETTPGCLDSECSRHEIFRRASLSVSRDEMHFGPVEPRFECDRWVGCGKIQSYIRLRACCSWSSTCCVGSPFRTATRHVCPWLASTRPCHTTQKNNFQHSTTDAVPGENGDVPYELWKGITINQTKQYSPITTNTSKSTVYCILK